MFSKYLTSFFGKCRRPNTDLWLYFHSLLLLHLIQAQLDPFSFIWNIWMQTKWWTRFKFPSEIFGCGENERQSSEISCCIVHWFGDGSETNFSLFGKSKEENSAPNSKSNSHSGPALHTVDNRSPFPACQSKTLLPEGKVTSFLAVQDSSITDIVCPLVCRSQLTITSAFLTLTTVVFVSIVNRISDC